MVVSHNANEIRSTPVPAAANIAILAQGCDVVGIDEAQFFDDEIVRVCNDLANQGIRVIVAGLDMDFKKSFWTHAGSYGYCRIRN
jgi:thymidine kinase